MKFVLLICLFIVNTANAKDKTSAAKVGDAEGGRAANQALNEMLRAYEAGDTAKLKTHLDSSMIGYQKLLDGISLEANNCKQMRLNLLNTKTQVGPDLAVIQSSWEKRCLQVPGLKPVLETGQSSFLMHKNTNGWKMTGISGSNPLTPVNLPATLKASTSTSCSSLSFISTPITEPFTITVTDPYQSKATSVRVKVSSGNDSENITLNALAGQPGVFQTTTLLIGTGTGTSGNGAVEVVLSSGTCASVRVAYVSNSAMTGVQTLQSTVLFP